MTHRQPPLSARRALTPKAKAALWQAQDERCAECRCPITLAEMQDDHENPIWCGGNNDPDNRQGLCVGCHKFKTKGEAKARGKVKRLERERLYGRKVRVSKIESRGFNKHLSKRFDGTVEVRT